MKNKYSKDEINLKNQKKILKEHLYHRKEIIFVYIYGSYARKTNNNLSDLDIAIYVENKNFDSGAFGYRSELIATLSSLLKIEVDLIILNDVSNFLAYNVLKDGYLIFCKSETKRKEFHYNIMSKYLDFLPAKKVQDDYLNKRINSNKYGR